MMMKWAVTLVMIGWAGGAWALPMEAGSPQANLKSVLIAANSAAYLTAISASAAAPEQTSGALIRVNASQKDEENFKLGRANQTHQATGRR